MRQTTVSPARGDASRIDALSSANRLFGRWLAEVPSVDKDHLRVAARVAEQVRGAVGEAVADVDEYFLRQVCDERLDVSELRPGHSTQGFHGTNRVGAERPQDDSRQALGGRGPAKMDERVRAPGGHSQIRAVTSAPC